MSTSGSSDFSVTRTNIIQEAYELGGIVRTGQALDSAKVTKGSFVLNAMVKSLMASGIHLWAVTEAVLIPQSEQIKYDVGTTSTDHMTLESDYVKTTVIADTAAGVTSITVTDDDGISDNDHVAIILDDGTVQFTTVNGAPASNVVTLDAALTDSVEAGAAVMAYTNKLVRPIKIPAGRRRNLSTGYETNLTLLPRLDYRSLAIKDSEGLPSQYFYDPQLSLGQLHIYQRETAITEVLVFTVHRPIEDFDTAADNPDLPQEWIKALNYGLALDLGDSFDIPQQRYQRILRQFETTMQMLAGHDREEGSIFLQPDMG